MKILFVYSPERQTIASFLRLAQMFGIIDSFHASTLIINKYKCFHSFNIDVDGHQLFNKCLHIR